MVYIHVGSYRVGSGSVYVGNIVAQHDVVVVTVNYRLGALGMLATLQTLRTSTSFKFIDRTQQSYSRPTCCSPAR